MSLRTEVNEIIASYDRQAQKNVGMGMLTGAGKLPREVGQAISVYFSVNHIGAAETVTLKWYVSKANPLPYLYAPSSEWSLIGQVAFPVNKDLSVATYGDQVTTVNKINGKLPATDYTEYDCRLELIGADGMLRLGAWYDDVYTLLTVQNSTFDSLTATFS